MHMQSTTHVYVKDVCRKDRRDFSCFSLPFEINNNCIIQLCIAIRKWLWRPLLELPPNVISSVLLYPIQSNSNYVLWVHCIM